MASAALGTAYRHLRDLFAAGSTTGLEDGQLLARYSRSNDPAAFEALVGRHGPMVLATCRAVLRNEHDVEDAFQATFLVLARRAGSVRGPEALGGWLHRVAYRASVQASIEGRKRRQKEAEAAMARTDSSRPESDLAALLHEEIDRLPGSLRLPVVLCDLEGLSYDEAARQLGWTLPSLRHRLANGRQKLKGRLARRGGLPLVIGAALAPKARAAVPSALVRATVALAAGSSPSAGVALLTHTLLRGMLMTKLKIAGVAALAALALASSGPIAAGGGKPAEDPKPAMQPKARDQASKPEPSGVKPAETVEVRGVVVAPDGKPVAGARVRGLIFDREERPFPEATCDQGGRFAIRVPKLEWDLVGVPSYPWLIASAPGHGIGWALRSAGADRPLEQIVTLPEEGPQIEGRVIDLEGRPVAGASIRATTIWYDEKGDLPAWIARARNGAEGNLSQALRRLPLEKLFAIGARTDAEGRFKIAGVGRDRIADLIVAGPGIANTEVHVFSRAEPEIRSADKANMNKMPLLIHAPKFQVAAMPSKRIEGVARDKDTGRPIAGLTISAGVFDEVYTIPAPDVEATTDAEGRYRLEGLPRATAYRLFVKPKQGQPYPNSALTAKGDSPALEPVAFDFALKRGVIVRGRVTDKVTGRPIGGHASYFAFQDNTHLKEYPGFERARLQYANLDEDGRYELVALPGRGLVAVVDGSGRYRPASGFEAIRGYRPGEYPGFDVLPYILPASAANIFAEVVADPKAESMTLGLRADPGKSVAIDVVDPDGRPLGGTQVKGMSEVHATSPFPQDSPGFEVHALDPTKPRRVIVMHEARKLIGSAYLKGDEPGPIAIKLQPWGSVAGRIVDDEGKPRKGMFLNAPDGSQNKHPETDDILPWSDWNNGIRVGDDGRFLVEGLVPGLRYAAKTRSGFEVHSGLFEGVTVAPGEAKDLGDLKVQPPKP